MAGPAAGPVPVESGPESDIGRIEILPRSRIREAGRAR